MEGAEGQYSGMQIGQLQDEEDEAANIFQDDSSESFRNSSVGMLINGGGWDTELVTPLRWVLPVHLLSNFQGTEDSHNGYEKQITRLKCKIRSIFQHF